MKYELTQIEIDKLKNYEFEERAAIIEFDAGIRRFDAEILARPEQLTFLEEPKN